MTIDAAVKTPRITVPVWSRVLSLITIVTSLFLVGLTTLHWGGHYQPVAMYAFYAIPILWGVIGLTFVFFLIHGVKAGDLLDLVVLIFIGYAAYSYQWTPSGYAARFEMLWILIYGGVFISLRHCLHLREWTPYLLLAIVLVTLLNTLYAIWCRNDPTPLIWGLERPDYAARVSGMFGCPNHFANLGVMGVLTSVFLGAYSRFPWPMRIVLFYLAGILSLGIFLSVSRGGYLAWAAGLGCVALFAFRAIQVRWWWKALLITLIIVGVTLAILRNDFVMERWGQAFSQRNIRIQLVFDAITIWEQSPWKGTGMASFDDYHLRLPYEFQHRAVYTHNDYFNTLSDYGLIGVGIIATFIILLFIALLRQMGDQNERAQLSIRLGLAALVAMAVHEVVDFNLHLPACSIVFFVIIALASTKTFREYRPYRKAWLSGVPFIIIISILIAVTGFQLSHKTIQGIEKLNVPAQELVKMPSSEVIALGEEGYDIDSKASDYLMRFGDALRVKAAKLRKPQPGEGASDQIERLKEREKLGQAALLFYERAWRGSPMDDELLVKKAMTLDVMDREQEAYLNYQRALEARPKSRFFHQALAYHFIKRGETQLAIEQMELALKLPGGTSGKTEFIRNAPQMLRQWKEAHKPTLPTAN